MSLVDFHGLAFDFLPDGELNDLRLTDREEFMAHHGEEFAANENPNPTRHQIEEYGRDRLADEARRKCDDFPYIDPYSARGLSRSDFFDPRHPRYA